jgi:hypothetical protein
VSTDDILSCLIASVRYVLKIEAVRAVYDVQFLCSAHLTHVLNDAVACCVSRWR